MGIEIIRAKLDPNTFKVDINDMAKKINKNTICVNNIALINRW